MLVTIRIQRGKNTISSTRNQYEDLKLNSKYIQFIPLIHYLGNPLVKVTYIYRVLALF